MHQLIREMARDSNEPLWFKASLALGQLYLLDDLSNNQTRKLLEELIIESKKFCQTSPNSKLSEGVIHITNKTDTMFQILDLDLQYGETIKSSLRIALIKETRAKLLMGQQKWDEALQLFWESFKELPPENKK